jgi:hypothetical protein
MHEYRKNTMKDLIEEVNPKKSHDKDSGRT